MALANEATAAALHERIHVIDGLVFFSDGYAGELQQGGVNAVNLTVCGTESDFADAVEEIGSWVQRAKLRNSQWLLVRKGEDLDRARQSGRVGLIMGLQNGRPLGNRLSRVGILHGLGVRVIQLTYNYANFIGDGCLEPRNAGLTRFGIDAVDEMNRIGIAIDLSHCGERTTIEAAKRSCKPVLATHANASAVAKRVRNKSDDELRTIADGGGVIGASIHGFMNWNNDPKAPPTLDGFIEHVRHMGNVAGYDHIGIGTDFASVSRPDAAQAILDLSATAHSGACGDYVQSFGNSLAKRYPDALNSPRHMARMTASLLAAGLSESIVEGIMGGNLKQALSEIWC